MLHKDPKPFLFYAIWLFFSGLGWQCNNNLGSILEYYQNSDLRTEQSWTEPNFHKRLKLQLKYGAVFWGGSTQIANFPLLLKLTPAKFDYSSAQDRVLKIIHPRNQFAELPYEVELWNSASTSYLWVKVDQAVKDADSDYFYLYFNASSGSVNSSYQAAVWADEYKLIFHMNGNQGNGNSVGANGSSNGGITPINNNCAVAECVVFNGSSQFLDTNYNNLPSQWTLSLWLKPTALPGASVTANAVFTFASSFGLVWNHSDNNFQGAATVNNHINGQKFSNLTTQWQHLAFSYDGSNIRTYRNGVFQVSKNVGGPLPAAADDAVIGRSNTCTDTACYFDGSIDEVRLSSVVRSDNYLQMEYQSSLSEIFEILETQTKP